MKLQKLYTEAVKKGIESDIRGSKAIAELLKQKKAEYEKLDKKDKEYFDLESLTNPFADTRILHGDPNANIKSVIVGIDVDPAEIILADRLNEKGTKIDLVIAHHPEGKAYANFYEVMGLQVDALIQKGVNVAAAENLLGARMSQVQRRVDAANHQRSVDIAKLLGINFMCQHTVCDNLAYQYMEKAIKKAKPKTLGQIMDLLLTIPEYQQAAKYNNPPMITVGSRKSRCSNIHIEFTGGTEGPKDIYKKLACKGVDTIIAMHQSEEHHKMCKEANINVIIASHIASDNLGINCMLDHLCSQEKIKVYEFSGFRRFARKKSK